MDERIDRILKKLEKVRGMKRECFRSESHQFRLNPPLNEAQVRAFETKHRIQLPDDYRVFLLQAGSSGAGPYYGLYPLERSDQLAADLPPDFLERRSPLRPDLPDSSDWLQLLGCPKEDLFQGSINIGTRGCTYEMHLIVSGLHRGRVVYTDFDLTQRPYFVRDTGFLAWYERWLDELLWNYSDSWFGYGMPGNEESLAPLLSRAETSPEDLHEALQTLSRAPVLADSTLVNVMLMLRNESTKVRSLAAYLLGEKHYVPAVPQIQALLLDEDAYTRERALRTLAKFSKDVWVEAARHMLKDDNHEVVFAAITKLKDAEELRVEDALPLLKSHDPQLRKNALWACPDLVASNLDVLDDPNLEVRRHAVLAKMRDRDFPRQFIARLQKEPDPEILDLLVRGLGDMGDQQAVEPLIKFARHEDAVIRYSTAVTLGRLRDVRAIPVLQTLLKDDTTPERRDERGILKMAIIYTVADAAKDALKTIRGAQPYGFEG